MKRTIAVPAARVGALLESFLRSHADWSGVKLNLPLQVERPIRYSLLAVVPGSAGTCDEFGGGRQGCRQLTSVVHTGSGRRVDGRTRLAVMATPCLAMTGVLHGDRGSPCDAALTRRNQGRAGDGAVGHARTRPGLPRPSPCPRSTRPAHGVGPAGEPIDVPTGVAFCLAPRWNERHQIKLRTSAIKRLH